jgi:hypothetical protein
MLSEIDVEGGAGECGGQRKGDLADNHGEFLTRAMRCLAGWKPKAVYRRYAIARRGTVLMQHLSMEPNVIPVQSRTSVEQRLRTSGGVVEALCWQARGDVRSTVRSGQMRSGS